MYLARLSDEGELSVWQIEGLTAESNNHGGFRFEKARPKVWRYGERPDGLAVLCGGGWAAIKHTEAIAIMSVHAAAEQLEAA
jgi:hypothetical protein